MSNVFKLEISATESNEFPYLWEIKDESTEEVICCGQEKEFDEAIAKGREAFRQMSVKGGK